MAAQVENKICAHCGADIRRDALFCYGCGSSVAPETIVALKDKNDYDGKTLVLERSENGSGKTTKLNEPQIENVPDKAIPKPPPTNNAELKSAAAMRRKSKIYQPKHTEIIWEERGSAINVWFVLSAIILTLLAAVIFYLADYLK